MRTSNRDKQINKVLMFMLTNLITEPSRDTLTNNVFIIRHI